MRTLIIVFLSMLCTVKVIAQPSWSADLMPSDFEHNMFVRTSLIDICNSTGDIVAVFSADDGELRGVSGAITNSDTFLITVFSEQSSGEEMVFRLYDAESDAVFDISDVGFSFLRNTVLGLASPVVIPGTESVQPVARCNNMTVYLDTAGQGSIAVADIDNGSTDNCHIANRTLDKEQFTCADLGSQMVTLTITDSFGNSSTCISTVTVVDTIPPHALCSNPIIYANESGIATLVLSDIDESTDNCGIATRSLSKTIFSKNESRNQTITLTVTDVAGLVSTCISKVTIVNNFENDIINCSDGFDNDMDGLVDCADPDCAKPSIQDISGSNPTPLSCTTTQADGIINIKATNADLYSVDGGSTTKLSGINDDLIANDYTPWVQNSETGCSAELPVTLHNTFDPLWNVKGFDIEGPQSLCANSNKVTFSNSIPAALGSTIWSLGNQVINSIDQGEISKLTFTEITGGFLVAKITGVCHTVTDSMAITAADSAFCSMTDCATDLFLSNEVIDLEGAADVYRAQSFIHTNGSFDGNNTEISAGDEMVFFPTFEVKSGVGFVAEVRGCGE